MKKYTLAFLILIVVLSLFIVPTIASSTIYLSVNGVKVTSDNCSDILKDGTTSYDPATKTLTLNNATISEASNYSVNGVSYSACIANLDELKINLIGNNTISVGDSYEHVRLNRVGIYLNEDLSIIGSGTLTITEWRESDYGICAKSLTIDKATVDATNSEVGIWLLGNNPLTVKSGSITARGNSCAMKIGALDLSDYSNHAIAIGTSEEDAVLCYNRLTAEQISNSKYIRIGPGLSLRLEPVENGDFQVKVVNDANLPISAALLIAAYNDSGKMINVKMNSISCLANSSAKAQDYTPPVGYSTVKAFLLDPIDHIPICIFQQHVKNNPYR